MRDEILVKLYSDERILEYLRKNPKWYYYLDLDPRNYIYFEREAKEALNMTVVDKIENLKKQINFVSSLIKYLSNK
ncbi:MAG: hypothetical protein GX203_03340 [Acholeplasmataceae bacterium]|nr:hypothetical protein [Acholeplasmataceae bacterium]HOA63503.1 YlbE-like family protein [Bacilli bacterium]HPT89296.1 YlbE-like family protein [Bacilli bacterium]HQA19621.1 YlbE-like family protein [Bacilli bacterium]HQD91695.1 YlbE-like family protein [Bacilli bacterium]